MSAFDIFLADCPARTTLALIGDTWSVVVIAALGESPRRFSDLQDRLGGVSNKVLSDVLRRLRTNGIIERRESSRRAIEYRLTPLGATLLPPVMTLSRWAEQHTSDLLDAQVTNR